MWLFSKSLLNAGGSGAVLDISTSWKAALSPAHSLLPSGLVFDCGTTATGGPDLPHEMSMAEKQVCVSCVWQWALILPDAVTPPSCFALVLCLLEHSSLWFPPWMRFQWICTWSIKTHKISARVIIMLRVFWLWTVGFPFPDFSLQSTSPEICLI